MKHSSHYLNFFYGVFYSLCFCCIENYSIIIHKTAVAATTTTTYNSNNNNNSNDNNDNIKIMVIISFITTRSTRRVQILETAASRKVPKCSAHVRLGYSLEKLLVTRRD